MSKRCRLLRVGVLAAIVAMPAAASAQVDLSGGWGSRLHEDQPDRTLGPEVGMYVGLPINDAGRDRADAWSASMITVPERQCIPHPSDYGNAFSNVKIWYDVDPLSGDILAYHTEIQWMTPVRTIWMDGRPHPSESAPHTYQGFSTGKWEGDALVVTTTHLKNGYIRRNGIGRTENATVYERFTRNGDVLTWVTVIDDPALLTEPYIKSRNFVYDPGLTWGPYPCSVEVEIPGDQTRIPHNLPGQNPYLNEWAAANGIPEEASKGGAVTMYPEYMARIRTLPPAPFTPVIAPGAQVIRPAAAEAPPANAPPAGGAAAPRGRR